jgi:predicted permease
MLFLNVFSSSALPLFVLIGIGFLADRLLKPDITTLSRLNFYILLPAALFMLVYETDLQVDEILRIGAFTLVHTVVLFVLAVVVFSFGTLAEQRPTLVLGTVFSNFGNYGIPMMLVAFGQQGVSVITMVLAAQVILVFTVGVVLFGAGQDGFRQSLSRLIRYPTLYAIALGFALRILHVTLPPPIQVPFDQLVVGFIVMALVTLGAQLSRSQVAGDTGPVAVVTLIRLIVSPLAAAALTLAFSFEPEMSRILIVATGVPVAINTYILALEFDRDPALASRMIFWTTLISAVSIPALLLILR